MATSIPLRVQGRTLISEDPDKLVWILLARESTDRQRQLDHQLTDLRSFVTRIGGRVDREVPENAVSAFKRKQVRLPDGTFGYRVVRPEWEKILTSLRRGECNALAVPDIDRSMRDPRTLEDLIDAVEYYGLYVASLTGNIDLTTDAGISAARSLVNQRNQESRNTARRVVDGQRHAALEGKNHGGPLRSFGWRKDRLTLNKREAKHLRRELPRIEAGVKPLTLAREWNKRGIPTVAGVGEWRAATIQNMYLRPRICGLVTYRGEILHDSEGREVKGQWEPILTRDQYESVVAAWGRSEHRTESRLGGHGRGYHTSYLLSPFVRCGKCSARMVGARRRNQARGTVVTAYRCPAKGAGGCGSLAREAALIDEYITELVIAEHQKIQFTTLEELPPWPNAGELVRVQELMAESQREYEAGRYKPKLYFPSIARMEAQEAALLREKRAYERSQQNRKRDVANLADEWKKPDFTTEQKQAAIAETLTAIVILPAGKGRRFHPDQIRVVWNEAD